MIAPHVRTQRRRLIRARTLSAFRQMLVQLATSGDPLAATRRALILPTRASAELFRQTLEASALRSGRSAVFVPELLTRDEWMVRLHGALADSPGLLTGFEREILMERAARSAAARRRMPRPPFEIRPAIVSEMLALYDELRRRRRTVRRFSQVLFDELGVERGTDRGSESLIHQTCFLAFAFLGYERGVASSGGLDEHEVRRRIVQSQTPCPFDHLVIAVADHPADPRGLWPADFDLLGRVTGLRELDVVVTDEMHDAGFRERMEQELPGIEEIADTTVAAPPLLVLSARSAAEDPEGLCCVDRDREEELRTVARVIRRRASDHAHELREPAAVVFQRPLPYLYLAQQVFADARVPFQALDALPLAGEPYAALLDLVLDVARTGGTREGAVALLRSPLLQFVVDAASIADDDAAALDAVLRERRASGEADTYPGEVDGWFGGRATRHGVEAVRAGRAARAAASIWGALQPFRTAAAASAQIGAVSRFLRRHQLAPGPDQSWHERYSRARAAVLGVLDGLTDACRRHDDQERSADALVAVIRHGIERHTFATERRGGGVRLVDGVAARFGEFDHVHLVGLVETEWPERPRRSIFYTTGLLKSLGWPQESDQVRAQQAAFRDLLTLPARTLWLHGFQLEGDAIVALSPLIDLARGLETTVESEPRHRSIFADELLTADPPASAGLDAETAEWLRLRVRRPPLSEPRYGGFVGPQAPQAYRVSRVDRYVDCPFKYFAENVLGLPEEREESSGLSPLERGTLVHTLFEEFYRLWQ